MIINNNNKNNNFLKEEKINELSGVSYSGLCAFWSMTVLPSGFFSFWLIGISILQVLSRHQEKAMKSYFITENGFSIKPLQNMALSVNRHNSNS